MHMFYVTDQQVKLVACDVLFSISYPLYGYNISYLCMFIKNTGLSAYGIIVIISKPARTWNYAIQCDKIHSMNGEGSRTSVFLCVASYVTSFI